MNHLGGPRITGTLQGLYTIVHNQGWKQLFAGLSLNYVKVMMYINEIVSPYLLQIIIHDEG